MTNLKRVPFDYERWKADGSRLDRVEYRNGEKPAEIYMSTTRLDGSHVFPLVTWNYLGHYFVHTLSGCNTINSEYASPSDLFLLIEPRTRIELDGLVADREFNKCWSISNRLINICTYYNNSKFLRYHCDVSIPTINTILSLIKLIQDEEANTEAGS